MIYFPQKVHQPRDFAAEVFAVDDEIDEAVLLEELAPLKPFGQLDLDRVPDRARPGEADQRLGLGDDEVAEHGEARGHAAGRRVGQQRDEQPAGVVEPGQRRAGLGHLHQRERATPASAPRRSS